jgi:probable F420-dependent oxidoreductase
MRVGMFLRNSGPNSTRATIMACARAADTLGLDDLWVLDHVAIPPDEAEGSGGRYVDPLATLAFAAGITERVRLGASVLIAPYRPPLPTAKWLASIQELSNGRLCAGFGVGWMAAEFQALGVDRRRRGIITDETLRVIVACFASDEVEINGQRFLFNPRPPCPPILIGGAAANAFRRVVEFGQGWMPNDLDPDKLRGPAEELKTQMRAAGKPDPEIIPLSALPLDDTAEAADRIAAYADAGATGIDHPGRYADVDEFSRNVEKMLEAKNLAGF